MEPPITPITPTGFAIRVIRAIRGPKVLLFLCLLTACGRVGDPLPPFVRIPEAVKDLAATQIGYNIVLTWTNPPRNIDGSAATNLAHIQIRSGDGSTTTVPVTAAGQAQSVNIPIAPTISPTTSSEQRFTLLVDTKQGKVSNISNAVSITPVQVPGRVDMLVPLADQRRIFLRWNKPQDHPELADAYVVVRVDLPAESETVSETQYDDTRYEAGKSFTYQVTAVRRVSGKVITGIGPETVTVIAEDKTAPQVPTGLDIVRSDPGAYLTWNANPEMDLAGYRVFRSERSDGDFKPISDRLIRNSGLFEVAYRPGWYYAVSAVDEFNNESAMSAPLRGP